MVQAITEGCFGRRLLFAICVVFSTEHSSAATLDKIETWKVSDLLDTCVSTEPSAKALCIGIAAGIASQLQANGLMYRFQLASEDERKHLKLAGAACGPIWAQPALDVFIGWAKIHPEFHSDNGLVGVARAIALAWPCND
jgi:hypothetical protein